MWTLGTVLSVLGLLVGYLGWKASQFERPSEIESSVLQDYEDYRVYEDAGMMYRATRVLAEKPGFPERLYKYLPKIKRAGFVDIHFVIEPYQQEHVVLPSPEEIEAYDLFPDDGVQIRQAQWSSNTGTQNSSLILRVHDFKSRYVSNAAYAAITSIIELKSGEIDENVHAQYKHTDIEPSDLESRDDQ